MPITFHERHVAITFRGPRPVPRDTEAAKLMIDDESSEEEVEVVEAMVEVVEKEVCPQLDPSILGVPGLKTLVPGDRVEVLWTHGVPHASTRTHTILFTTPCLLTMLLTLPCLLTTPTLPCA